ncbi:MAG: hypothetical protein LBU45_00160 [Azoarcus sp.]|jgi:hypothetical protein|nr:hypothetical protein [Azoarcus sp.]
MNTHHGIFLRAAATCAVLCLNAFQAQAAEVSIPQCPGRIHVQQDIKSPAEDGWKSADAAIANNTKDGYRLKDIGFSYSENPEKPADFIVPSEKRKQLHHVFFYDGLNCSKKGTCRVVCTYWETSVTLARKIPNNIKRCVLRYPNGYPDVFSFRCFDTPRKK